MNFENIGKKIRILRKRYSITLSDIASKTGISLSTLSLIENGKLVPTLKNLDEIATFFGVHISYFFEDNEGDGNFIYFKKEDLPSIESKNFHSKLTFLLPKLNIYIHPVLVEIKPKGRSGPPTRHKGWDFAYILKGKCRVYIGDESIEVKEGDSLLINSDHLHYAENIDDEVSLSIWIGIEEGVANEKNNK